MAALAIQAADTPPLLAVLAPFILSIVFLVLSPLAARRATKNVQDQINVDSAKAGQAIVGDMFPIETIDNADGTKTQRMATIPVALAPSTIGTYVEKAVDLAGFVPSTLLPVTGAIFALYADIGQGTVLTVLLISVIAAICGDLVIATTPAQNWTSKKPLRMSLAALAGIVANIASIVLIAVAS